MDESRREGLRDVKMGTFLYLGGRLLDSAEILTTLFEEYKLRAESPTKSSFQMENLPFVMQISIGPTMKEGISSTGSLYFSPILLVLP